MLHIRVCFVFLHFVSLLTIFVVEQNVVAYANISKQQNKFGRLVQMKLYYTLKLFLQFVGINCKVKPGRLPCSLENFTQITQTFVISWYIDDIEANLPFGKKALRVFT